MSKVVLDASAVTAVLRSEHGHENVIPHLPGSLISSVNLAEVFCTARSFGSLPEMDERAIQMLQIKIVPFDAEQAKMVANIHSQTLGGSISIADFACMSLALLHKLPILTGNHEWQNYDVGVDVHLFRKPGAA